MASSDLAPLVAVHYGIPSTASILAFDPIQCLLAVGTLVLIAYENGLIILWDVTEDRAVHVKGYKDLQLKGGIVVNFSDNESHTDLNDSLDNEEAEKEISSLCWVSPDGSVLAVGYVDGDILLWNLSVSDNGKSPRTPKSSNDVVKIQLSSGDRRLPVIVLHWSPNKAQNGRGGQLFAYGGEEIGSEEVLTILDLDWSSGLAKLKCVERVDLFTLHGSFADVIIISNAYKVDNSNETSLFVLTNPGQLHFYQYASLSILKSEKTKNHSVHALQYHSVIPTVEPYMTVGELYMMNSERNILSALSETVSPAKQQSDNMLTGGSAKWPLTGGVLYRMSSKEGNNIERIYVGGYQDGSVRIWDATCPVLSLVSEIRFEVQSSSSNGMNVLSWNFHLCHNLTDSEIIDLTTLFGMLEGVSLMEGEEDRRRWIWDSSGAINQEGYIVRVGKIFHRPLARSLFFQEFMHLHRQNRKRQEIQSEVPQDQKITAVVARTHCSTVYSLINSPVCALQFGTSGVRLVAGLECGQVAVLDTSSPSVLFITDIVSSSSSPVISLVVKTSPDTHENSVKNPDNQTESESATEIAFILTRDAHMVLMDSITGNMISSLPMHPKEKSIAINMYLLGKYAPVFLQFSVLFHNRITYSWTGLSAEVKHPLAEGSKDDSVMSSQQIEAQSQPLLTHPQDQSDSYGKSLILGDNKFVHELKLEKPCSWTTIFKRDAERYGLIVVYQAGEIEIRSLPELELLGNTSMMSILRWNFKTNMDKTMSASDKGQITLTLPCLHDEVLAAAADADSAMPGFVSNVIKGLKGVKEEQDMNYGEAREFMIAHLEKIFSRFPFSNPYNDIEDLDLQIGKLSHLLDSERTRNLEGTEREKLFEGGSTDTKPTVRTREEIIAKYRKSGDAAGAASQAKDKLMERQEKLEKLSRRTEELQSGAENFASMANELAKAMEKLRA
ncbi:hypothetical protein DH2020_044219 [Rehmannia glutinosa]|uniref:V-SNARE coiled-coil homology domain-containing protein n=1 Tax=Rehmannia glutinosa TaxID=99300 RepID=A0ABR0UJ56_REHGL